MALLARNRSDAPIPELVLATMLAFVGSSYLQKPGGFETFVSNLGLMIGFLAYLALFGFSRRRK